MIQVLYYYYKIYNVFFKITTLELQLQRVRLDHYNYSLRDIQSSLVSLLVKHPTREANVPSSCENTDISKLMSFKAYFNKTKETM